MLPQDSPVCDVDSMQLVQCQCRGKYCGGLTLAPINCYDSQLEGKIAYSPHLSTELGSKDGLYLLLGLCGRLVINQYSSCACARPVSALRV